MKLRAAAEMKRLVSDIIIHSIDNQLPSGVITKGHDVGISFVALVLVGRRLVVAIDRASVPGYTNIPCGECLD